MLASVVPQIGAQAEEMKTVCLGLQQSKDGLVWVKADMSKATQRLQAGLGSARSVCIHRRGWCLICHQLMTLQPPLDLRDDRY